MSTLEAFVAIQLLYDPEHKPHKVGDSPLIPAEPKLLGKKSHLVFNKSDVVIKELSSWIKNSSSNGALGKMVSIFWSNNSHFKELDGLIKAFEMFLINDQNLTLNDEEYYQILVQFVDLLLSLKSSEANKRLLLQKRDYILALQYIPLPDIHDSNLRQMICDLFDIDETKLFITIRSIQKDVDRREVGRYVRLNGLCQKYMPQDFDSIAKYENWKIETTQLEASIIKEFGDTPNCQSFKFVPLDMVSTVTELSKMMLTAKPEFLKCYMDCLRIWQFDPFSLNFIFIQLIPTPNPELQDIFRFLAALKKATGLALTCAPVQIEFNDWPSKCKKQMLESGMKVYERLKPSLGSIFLHFFDDSKTFTNALLIIRELKLTSNSLGVKTYIKECISSSLKERFDTYYQKSGIEKQSQSKMSFDQMASYLTVVSRDINLLYNWKVLNAELNTTFGIYEYGSKIIMTPVLSFVKDFVNKIKNEAELKRSSRKANFLDSNTRQSFSTFLDNLNSLKERTGFKFDYQSELFEDFLYLVDSWQTELHEQVKEIIRKDIQNHLQRIDGSSCSNSARNLIGILDGYVKLLDSFQWSDPRQRALLDVRMYKIITTGVEIYYTAMFKILESNIKNVINLRSEACTSLNNLMAIFVYMEKLSEKDNIKASSDFLISNGLSQLKSPTKFVSIDIKQAENVEDIKGSPVSLKVLISGLLTGTTRTIYKDFNPEWFESFSGFIDERKERSLAKSTTTSSGYGSGKFSSSSKNMRLTILSIDDNATESTYKSINFNINLNKENINMEDKRFSLAPKFGKLVINTGVEFEKNDPLFYIEKCKTLIQRNITRAVKLFLDEYTLKMKEIFSREYLDKSLLQAPPGNEINYQRLMDANLNSYIGSMRNKVIPEMFNNLDDSLFNTILKEIWEKAIKRGEDLLLPRLSLIDRKIINKLNKRSSSSSPLTDNYKNRSTSLQEVTRVIEWCFKFREMMDISVISPELQVSFNKDLDKVINIKNLISLNTNELSVRYYHAWSYVSHKLKDRKCRSPKFDYMGWDAAQKDKRLISRVMFAKGDVKNVKRNLEIERRFERAITTELEVTYLQQFI